MVALKKFPNILRLPKKKKKTVGKTIVKFFLWEKSYRMSIVKISRFGLCWSGQDICILIITIN